MDPIIVKVGNTAKGDKGDKCYVHFVFASQKPTEEHPEFGDTPGDWMGVASDYEEAAPKDFRAYQWVKIKGESGTVGLVYKVAGIPADENGNVPLKAETLSAATTEDLRKAKWDLEKTVREGLEAVRTVHTSTLAADGWEGDDAPFTQRVSVEGLTAADTPHVGPAEITSDELEESCRMITGVKALDGALLVTCRTDKPTVDIPIQVEVIR